MSNREKYKHKNGANHNSGDGHHQQKRIQSLLRSEGRSARNLISWNVPFEQQQEQLYGQAKEAEDRKLKTPVKNHESSNFDQNGPSYLRRFARKESHPRSDSGGTPRKSATNQNVRQPVDEKTLFWTFLIDNLDRAVDALYSVCDQNESIQQANEMKMILNNYMKDFDNLIDKINIQTEFDKAQEKPLSISWEVRKTSSPMKMPGGGNVAGGTTASIVDNTGSVRQLVFMSWADRVKGATANVGTDTNSSIVTSETASFSDAAKQSNHREEGVNIEEFAEDVKPANEDSESESGWEKYSKHKTGKLRTSSRGGTSSVTSMSTQNEKQSVPENDTYFHQADISKTKENLSPDSAIEGNNTLVEMSEQNFVSYNGNDEGSPGRNIVDGAINVSELEREMEVLPEYDQETDNDDDADDEDFEELEDDTNELDNELRECFERALEQCEEEETQLVHQLEDMSLQDVPMATTTTGVNSEPEENDENSHQSLMNGESHLLPNGYPGSNSHAIPTLDLNGVEDTDDTESASWADMVEKEEEDRRIFNLTGRDPSRALIIHERLSSPSRTSSWAEKKWRHEEKQRKAQEIRAKALEETMLKQRNLALRIQEVRRWKNEILSQKKKDYEQKLQLAESKRKAHLRTIVKKAHEEENKVNEIAFIMTLEAQNKRAEMRSKHEVYEARKQELEEGRLRKLEEARALEEAAKERRRTMEQEKETRLGEMQAKRECHMQRIAALQQARDQERVEANRKREEEREKKLALVVERERDAVEGLVKRLQEKQDESEARYRQLLTERQQRAAELAYGPNNPTTGTVGVGGLAGTPTGNNTVGPINGSSDGTNISLAQVGELNEKASLVGSSTNNSCAAPSLEPFATQKVCNLCNVQLKSEVHLTSHKRGKKHLEAIGKELNRTEPVTEQEAEQLNCKYIGDILSKEALDQKINANDDKKLQERLDNMKKKLKKVKTRMNQRAKEFELQLANSESKDKNVSDRASENKSKIQKNLKEINKLISAPSSGTWPENKVAVLDRSLGEIDRMFAKTVNNKQMESVGDADRNCFREQSGFAVICRVLLLANESFEKSIVTLPAKSESLAASVLVNCCLSGGYENCRYLLYGNKISPLIDIINNHLNSLLAAQPKADQHHQQPQNQQQQSCLPKSQIVSSLCVLIATVMDTTAKYAIDQEVYSSSANSKSSIKVTTTSNGGGDHRSQQVQFNRPVINDQCKVRVTDTISYIVCSGMFDKISQFFSTVRKSVYSDPEGANFLTTLMQLATSVTRALHIMLGQLVTERVSDDFTFLVATLKSTELLGSVSLLYGTLLHSDVVQQQQSTAPTLSSNSALVATDVAYDVNRNVTGAIVPPEHVLRLATSTLDFINTVALLDTTIAQEVLSEESLSLQLRHIASNLFNNCAFTATNLVTPQQHTKSSSSSSSVQTESVASLCANLVHEVILTIGYFTLLNSDNQLIIQAGSPPTLLQQLCTALPFHYFSDEARMDVLFPTLVACCHDNAANKNILQTEITPALLVQYLEKKKTDIVDRQPAENSLLVISGSKFELMKRFPIQYWDAAIQFFAN